MDVNQFFEEHGEVQNLSAYRVSLYFNGITENSEHITKQSKGLRHCPNRSSITFVLQTMTSINENNFPM